MDMHITARHFKAHETLRTYAFDAINKLEKFYDGILSAKLILSYERSLNSIKAAELIVKVQGDILKSLEKSSEYQKSIDAAVSKIERQLLKHKSKKHEKQKTVIRTKTSKA
ncbi:MAG: ribosome-associated translation inhibitor RaiA [Bacteroidota bacterium]